jgi:RinA family phage transcriptional activator
MVMSWRSREIRRACIRLIEAEIRAYPETLQSLKEIEQEIAEPHSPGAYIGLAKTTGHSDPTAKKALKMIESPKVRELQRRISAIRRMVRILKASPDPGRYKLIELTYWADGRYNVEGVCQKLNISKTTYNRWKNEALEIVAERLGWDI